MWHIIFIGIFPALAQFLCKRYACCKMAGPVVLCYGAGILYANISGNLLNVSAAHQASEIAIVFAIPLLLFSADFVQAMRYAGTALLSFVLAMVSVIIVTLIIAPFFQEHVAQSDKIAAMLVGVYTGGTPNLGSIGTALIVDKETMIVLNIADMAMGALYFFFLLSFAAPILRKILPPFPSADRDRNRMELSNEFTIGGCMAGMLLTGIICALSGGLSYGLYGEIKPALFMIVLTSLAILFSFYQKVRNWKGPYLVGDYFILAFCTAIGSMAQISKLLKTPARIFLYCACVMFAAVIFHYFFAKLFRIDADTAIITSTAALFGPAFIVPVAEALDNRDIIIAGITMGILGLALGNYLGLAVYYLLGVFG